MLYKHCSLLGRFVHDNESSRLRNTRSRREDGRRGADFMEAFLYISEMATVGRVVLFKIMSHASLPWHHNIHLNLLGSADKVGVGWALYMLRSNNIMAPEM